MGKIIAIFGFIFLPSVLVVLTLYCLFYLFPCLAYTESKCLAFGYPDADIDMYGRGYCLNIEGDVRGVAIPLKNIK